MPLLKEHFEELSSFIRQHRSNESNFEILHQKLEEELKAAQAGQDATYASTLQEIREKQAAEYRTAKEAGGSAWPEYEKFVSEWERALSGAKNGQD